MTDKSDFEAALGLLAETLGFSLAKKPDPKTNFLYTSAESTSGVASVTSRQDNHYTISAARHRLMARPMIKSKSTGRNLPNPVIAEGAHSWWSPETSFEGVMESTAEHMFWQLRSFHGRWVTVVKSNHLRNLGRVGFARMVIPFPLDDQDTPELRRGLTQALRSDKSLSAKLMVTFNVKEGQPYRPDGYPFDQTDSFAYPMDRLRLATSTELDRTFGVNGRAELPHIRLHDLYSPPQRNFPDKLQPLVGTADAPHPECSNWVIACLQEALAHMRIDKTCAFAYTSGS